MMRALQEEMAASRAYQERIQADLVGSRATSEELRRSNEELRRDLQNRAGEREEEDQEPATSPREFLTSFSEEIRPKVTFTGTEDPVAHLTVFR